MKTGLVLEGGALRAIFSSGVCDGLLEGGVMTDYVIGVSAGIAYGVSYVSKQPRRNLEVVTRFAPDKRYMGWRNLTDKSNRSYFGLKFGFNTIPNELVPFDYDTFAAFPGEVLSITPPDFQYSSFSNLQKIIFYLLPTTLPLFHLQYIC